MKGGILTLAAVLALTACGSGHRIGILRGEGTAVDLSPSRDQAALPQIDSSSAIPADTLVVESPDGEKMLIMRAVKDEDGEMVATDVVRASVVTARFRNVAERGGKVELRFDISVPGRLLGSRWQLRLAPMLKVFDEQIPLEQITFTGAYYRKAQLRGYQQYERYIASIISDTTLFIRRRQLEIFLRRNIPQVYRFRSDSTLVSDSLFHSAFGISGREAMEHFTMKMRLRQNRRRYDRRDEMFSRLVKAPIISEGLRLDTVISGDGGNMLYRYVQPLNTRPGLKKAMVTVGGSVYEQDRRIYSLPLKDTVTFYISSLSSFADGTERYLKKIVSRRVEANTACYIEFLAASSNVDPAIGNNAEEIGRIKENLRSLAENEVFEMDSIVVTASCSPEGRLSLNKAIAGSRSESVSDYFRKYLRHVRDSLKMERGMFIDMDGAQMKAAPSAPPIRFIAKSCPENWDMLGALVHKDSSLTARQKEDYFSICGEADLDARERALSRREYYPHLRKMLYPRLRTVRFNFYLHRKGMVEDTLTSTEPDTVYRAGVKALKDMDYAKAITILRPYSDFNTAVAYCALDYNASAMDILARLEPDDKVHYLMALLHSRMGHKAEAVEHYLTSCRLNPSFINRGNLDPEISSLINEYKLDNYNQ